MKQIKSEQTDAFYQAILTLKTPEECEKFFEDICTIKELQDISQRLDVARHLQTGENYQEISKQTGASTTTISRVNRCIGYGAGGYEIVLSRLDSEEK